MAVSAITRDEILQSTLFHIQLKRLEYIDNFPDSVADMFTKIVSEKGFSEFNKIKRRLYRISTSFFSINKENISKREFYQGLYQRLTRIAG
ncbi:MAG: hypothetical protein RTU92_11165 [Candidatus Thorarchaeota archaeon]